jgi:hypothetical protein
VFETSARIRHCWLLRNSFDKVTNLMVTWHGDGFPSTPGQLFCEFFESHILKDSHHCWVEWVNGEFSDELLHLWVNLSLTMIGRMRNTGDLSQFLGPVHQARKRGAWNAMCESDGSQTHSSQDSLNSREITVETNLIFSCGQRGGIKGWARKTDMRIKGKVSFVGFCRETTIEPSLFE